MQQPQEQKHEQQLEPQLQQRQQQQSFTIYHNSTKIKIELAQSQETIPLLESTFQQQLLMIGYINKIKCLTEKEISTIFLLNQNNELYLGILDEPNNCLILSKIKTSVIDFEIDHIHQRIFITNLNGCVFHLELNKINNSNIEWTELIISTTKFCSHDVKFKTNKKVEILKINSNLDGLLFTSNNGELFGMGNFGEILQSENQPMLVESLRGLKVLQVSTGDHFVIVLAQKKVSHSYGEIENDDDDDADDDYHGENNENDDFYSYSDISANYNLECEKCGSKVVVVAAAAASSTNKLSNNNNNNNNNNNKIKVPSLVPQSGGGGSSCIVNDDNIGGSQLDMFEFADNWSIASNSDYYRTILPTSSTSPTPEAAAAAAVPPSTSALEPILKHDKSQLNLVEKKLKIKIKNINRIGENLIGTSVWSFGTINKGQLGTGDHIKRKKINELLGLNGQGVIKIDSGREHSFAMTLDGRIFLWGCNTDQQISTNIIDDISSPKHFSTLLPILHAICGDYYTILIQTDLQIKTLCKNGIIKMPKMYKTDQLAPIKNVTNDIDNDDDDDDNEKMPIIKKKLPLCLATDNKVILQNHLNFMKISEQLLCYEQKFLEEFIISYNNCVKKYLKYIVSIPNYLSIDLLCQQYKIIMNFTTVNLKSIFDYVSGIINMENINFLENINEIITVYRQYTKYFCDVKAIQGFDLIDKKITTQNLNKSMIMLTKSHKLFIRPLEHCWRYIDLIRDLQNQQKENTECYYIKKKLLNECETKWKSFCIEKDLAVKEALNTANLWNEKNKTWLDKLIKPERRLIIDSKDVPIKLANSSRFSTHRFLLFNDIFCHYTNGKLLIHYLTTVWLQPATNKLEISKNAFIIITPEEKYMFYANNLEGKTYWSNSFERYIKQNLTKHSGYKFTDQHSNCQGGKYFGQWHLGLMHGIGQLEFLDGKTYYGQMKYGEINGFGRMFTPNSGIYVGDFVKGLFHGYGVLEMKFNEIYEGNFLNGLFHGHGLLRTDQFMYIGEFINGQKCGYGVFDDSISGNKYMGQFSDNKCNGFGVLITMDGHYFQGQFIDNMLNGFGAAVLSSGCYYEGELLIDGPNGNGKLYLPKTIENLKYENNKKEKDTFIMGNILSGTLSGNWLDVRINNGSIKMDQTFSKMPSSLGCKTKDDNKKWWSLFRDWEIDVFGGDGGGGGGGTNSTIPFDLIIWQKFDLFIRKSIERDQLNKSTNNVWNNDDLFKQNNNTRMNNLFDDSLSMNITNLTDNLSLNNKSIDTISIKSDGNVSQLNLYQKNDEIIDNDKIIHLKRSNSCINPTTSVTTITSINNTTKMNTTTSAENIPINNFKNVANLKEIFKNKRDIADILFNQSSLNSEQQQQQEILLKSNLIRPNFVNPKLDKSDLIDIQQYLINAFKDIHNPLGLLNAKISHCFYTSYGCWKVKPNSILSTQAMNEWEFISRRIYEYVCRLFPLLPIERDFIDGEMISFRSILYPILLSERVYSTLFVLYACKCSENDELYRQRLLICDKKTDEELVTILTIENKLLPLIKSDEFSVAITSLRQVKENYCPREMLCQIENTFKVMDSYKTNDDNDEKLLSADNVLPLIIFLILRAGIPHLGAELLLMEELMGSDFDEIIAGYTRYCFITIQAAYQHILSSNFFQD